MTKENYEKLKRAATMYANLTGETVDISEAKVEDPEADAREKLAAAQEELTRKAKVDRELEKAQQAARQIVVDAGKGSKDSEENPENKGPDQPATITERARQQGLKPAGK